MTKLSKFRLNFSRFSSCNVAPTSHKFTVYFKLKNRTYLFLYFFLFIYQSFVFKQYIFLSQSDVSDLATLTGTPHARYQSAWTRSDIQAEVTSQCRSCDGAQQSTKTKASLACAVCFLLRGITSSSSHSFYQKEQLF